MSGRGEGFGDAGERRGGAGRRVHFEALVAVGEASGGAGFEAESIDVSPDGMRLRAVYLPEVGERLLCRFDGPSGEITVEGEVCWRRDESRGGEFGLRFAAVDAAAAEAVRGLCSAVGGAAEAGGGAADAAAGAEPRAAGEARGPGRGARVRLHIEGLGSPMKARVREGREAAIEVGSNLEFLKIGRTLDLEDVDRGGRREAFVDEVRVEIEPGSRIPQLVVTLRYDEPARAARPAPARKGAALVSAGTGAAAAAAAAPSAEARGAGAPSAPPAEAPETEARRGAERAGDETPGNADVTDGGAAAADAGHDADASPALAAAEQDGAEPGSPPPPSSIEAQEPTSEARRGAGLRGVGQKAASVGRSVVERAGRVGPALSGAGARARGAMAGLLARIQQKRAERDEAKKSSGPRRMTAPPPAGALRSDGRRLVRDGSAGDAAEAGEAEVKPRVNKKAAALGSFLGLAAVLAVFGAARLMGVRSADSVADTASAGAATNGGAAPSSAPALPAPTPAGGTLSANVPLFGATPLSTTEPVPPSAPPADPNAAGAQDPLALAAAGAAAGAGEGPGEGAGEGPGDAEAGPGGEGDEPSLGDDGKAWGQGEVRNPTVLKLKMDGEIGNLSGAAGPMGFTVSLPDRRALSTGSGLARKDKRIASLRVVNTPQGAEVTLQFKDGVPAYVAKANGNRLEIALGNDGAPKKVAAKGKPKAGKKGKADPKKKAPKGKTKKPD